MRMTSLARNIVNGSDAPTAKRDVDVDPVRVLFRWFLHRPDVGIGKVHSFLTHHGFYAAERSSAMPQTWSVSPASIAGVTLRLE